MFIQKSYTSNGLNSEIHRIERVEFKDVVYVTLASYTTIESIMATTVESFQMPLAQLAGNDPMRAVCDWLASTEGPLAGGKVVAGYEELVLAQKKATESVTVDRDKYVAGGCITSEGVTDTDEVSIRNILGTCQIASMAIMTQSPFLIVWKFADNSTKELTAPKVMTMGKEVMQHVSTCYSLSWTLKDAIAAAETAKDVEKIDISKIWHSLKSVPGYVAPVTPTPDPTPPADEPETDTETPA